MDIRSYLNKYQGGVNSPIIHEGRSRTVKLLDNGLLLSEFKDRVHSNSDENAIYVDGTAKERVKIYEILNKLLVFAGLKSSAISFYDKYVCHRNVSVAENIEVIIKTQLIGSPKHIYTGITEAKNRFGGVLKAGDFHQPYIPLTNEDAINNVLS